MNMKRITTVLSLVISLAISFSSSEPLLVWVAAAEENTEIAGESSQNPEFCGLFAEYTAECLEELEEQRCSDSLAEELPQQGEPEGELVQPACKGQPVTETQQGEPVCEGEPAAEGQRGESVCEGEPAAEGQQGEPVCEGDPVQQAESEASGEAADEGQQMSGAAGEAAGEEQQKSEAATDEGQQMSEAAGEAADEGQRMPEAADEGQQMSDEQEKSGEESTESAQAEPQQEELSAAVQDGESTPSDDTAEKPEEEEPVTPGECASTLKHYKASASTYTSKGYKEFYKCKKCGRHYLDPDALQEVSKADLILDYLPPAEPVLVSAADSTDNGTITLKWKKAKGATAYRVYRKTAEGKWTTLVKSTTSVTFKDSSCKQGTVYYYTVRAYNSTSKKWSSYNTDGIGAVILKKTTLEAEPASSGISLSWKTVKGASAYRVYRKSSGGSWTKLATVRTLTYADSQAKAGTLYYYAVRPVNQFTGKTGPYALSESVAWLKNPKLTLTGNKKTISLSWGKVKGANLYRIYRKTAGGSWKKLVSSTTSLTYTDKSVESGVVYYYSVRAYNKSKKLWSEFDSTGKAGSTMAAVKMNSLTASGTTVTVSWKASAGADLYVLYRKIENRDWVVMAKTTELSWTDENYRLGATYTYLVKPYNKTLGMWGSYDTSSYKSYFATDKKNLSSWQKAVINSAENTETAPAGYCSTWVGWVLAAAGFKGDMTDLREEESSYAVTAGLTDEIWDTGFNANDYWAYVCTTSDITKLVPGMVIATRSSYSTAGSQYGHVGIYIGDNTVLSSIGYLETLDVDSWIEKYNNVSLGSTARWGLPPKTVKKSDK